MAIQKGPCKLIWKLLGRRDGASGEMKLNHTVAALKAQDVPEKAGDWPTIQNLQEEIRYDQFADGCDLQYIILPHKVKENIIVKQKGDSYRFEFMLKTKNLELELAENGQSLIAFAKQGETPSLQQAKREQGEGGLSAQQAEETFSPEQGEMDLSEKQGEIELSAEAKGIPEKQIVFRIPMPYMYDAKGAIGEDVSYDLEQKDGETYCFAIEADASWINAEERVLPVTIDPAIDVDEFDPILISNSAFNKTAGAHMTETYRYVGGGEDSIIPIGSGVYAKTYFKITLPQSLSNCKINHIGLKLKVVNHLKDTEETSKFFLRKCSTVNISEPPFYASEGEIIDYIRQDEVESDQYLEFDLTKLYKDGSTTEPRYACLSGYDGSSGKNDLLILNSETLYGHEGVLEIDYTLNRTLRSEEFQTNDVKRAGTHLVDLFTGNNKFVHRDHEFTEGKRLALEVSHVFNSWEKSHDYYTVSKGGYRTAALGMGRGWKLNVHQFAFKVAESASAYDNSLRYLYIDQNGDEISFVRSVTRRAVYSGSEVTEIQEKEEFLDEQGKKLKCYEEDGEIRIADDNGTVLSFRKSDLVQAAVGVVAEHGIIAQGVIDPADPSVAGILHDFDVVAVFVCDLTEFMGKR